MVTFSTDIDAYRYLLTKYAYDKIMPKALFDLSKDKKVDIYGEIIIIDEQVIKEVING